MEFILSADYCSPCEWYSRFCRWGCCEVKNGGNKHSHVSLPDQTEQSNDVANQNERCLYHALPIGSGQRPTFCCGPSPYLAAPIIVVPPMKGGRPINHVFPESRPQISPPAPDAMQPHLALQRCRRPQLIASHFTSGVPAWHTSATSHSIASQASTPRLTAGHSTTCVHHTPLRKGHRQV